MLLPSPVWSVDSLLLLLLWSRRCCSLTERLCLSSSPQAFRERLDSKLFSLAYLSNFFVNLPNPTPNPLCNKMILNLTQTYFCKSCTKTYNFSPKIADSERLPSFYKRQVPENFSRLCARWQAAADYDYEDMRRRVILHKEKYLGNKGAES